LNEFGSRGSSSKIGEFDYPVGLTVDNKYIYICDCSNHRVQILTKENGIYYSKWGTANTKGQFINPYGIYNHLPEDIIYVGDASSVQLFSKDGVCIQRLGEEFYGSKMKQFNWVNGICVMNDRLYVSDCDNRRIQIFKRTTSYFFSKTEQ